MQCVVTVWAGLGICGGVVVCAEPSVIAVVVTMLIEQSARDHRSKYVAELEDPHLKTEEEERNPGCDRETERESAWRSRAHAPPRVIHHHAGESMHVHRQTGSMSDRRRSGRVGNLSLKRRAGVAKVSAGCRFMASFWHQLDGPTPE
jgi:hypothetical protein